MKDVEIIGMIKSYVKKTLVGMGALKGAPCEVQGVVDGGDGTQILTLEWEDTAGVTHTTDITLPAAIFAVLNPSNGQTLRYNSVSGKFENSNVSFSADLEDLDNVVITSVQNGQVLTWDAATNKWVNANGSVVAALNDLTDVTITTAQNGQILVYNSTANKWVNATLEVASADVDYTNTTSGLAATNVQDAIDELASEKVDKETGKGLSTNDFTDALKDKLDGIEAGAEVNVIEEVQVNGSALTPSEKSVNIEAITGVKKNGSALTPTNGVVDVEAVDSVAVNGVSQTITAGTVDLDVANNLITEAQWTAIQALLV